MADKKPPGVSDEDYAKGRVSKPIPILCNSPIMPYKLGGCQRTEKAIEVDRALRASRKLPDDPTLVEYIENILEKREKIIQELTNRIFDWNQMQCPNCRASLEGKGPQFLSQDEVKYFEDRDWRDINIRRPAHEQNTEESGPSDAMASLKALLDQALQDPISQMYM